MAATKKASASTKGLDDLFLDGLKDIYYAEKKILKALPKMAKGADDSQVSAAFEKHLTETEGQVERLEQVFDILGVAARGKTCPPSTASSRKDPRSWRNIRVRPQSTRVLSPRRKRSSTMRLHATAP